MSTTVRERGYAGVRERRRETMRERHAGKGQDERDIARKKGRQRQQKRE